MKFVVFLLLISIAIGLNGEILIPMDATQSNHLKAYGVAFSALERQLVVKWLLNYRGGSYLIAESDTIINECHVRGVFYEKISSVEVVAIMEEINQANMDMIVLEKEPIIAVYVPPHAQPWDDAVRLALEYAEIPYETLWDEEVLSGQLERYDWIHLHHEDFTGQYGKFYGSFRNAPWYQEQVNLNEEIANRLGFPKVWELKHAVAEKIRDYVVNGGFFIRYVRRYGYD